jgi:hypothetical protein
MFARFRHVFAVLFFLIVASCSGGGCSGCGGCGGTTPLPGGFPKDNAIDNAASVRVSRPGLDFLQSNLPAIASQVAGATGGKLNIDIPYSDLGTSNVVQTTCVAGSCLLKVDIHPELCPGGPDPTANPPKCEAQVGIGQSTFRIDAVTPHNVDVTASIPLVLDNTPIKAAISGDVAYVGFGPITLTLNVAYGSNGSCNGATPIVSPKALPVDVSIPLVAETIAPRTGYTKVDVDNAAVNLSAISGDIQICADCGSLATNACNAVLNAAVIKNALVNQLTSGLNSQVKSLLKSQLCTKPNAAVNPPCPDGSQPDSGNSKCVYTSNPNTCVPMLLGTDAHIDLSGFLKSISPGTAGGLDFVLASGGDMKPFPNTAGAAPTTNGITLGMVGGMLPQPPSNCVPQATVNLPTGIPIPDELAPTTADPATAPHLGIALAGRYLDYSFTSVYNSGLLCLGVSTEQVDMLKSGLLSLLIPSIKDLTFEQSDAAAAIATRPQAPPIVKIGGGTDVNADPLLLITLPKFAIDFYIWSYDRFVRAFTFQADVTIPVNLQTGKDPATNPNGGILPALGDMKVDNGSVTNSDLILDDPALVSAALSGLLGSVSKQLVGGGFSPIDLSSSLKSLGLDMSVDKITKLTKGTDDFVGIFATLSKATAATAEADTTATLLSKKVPVDHMQLATLSRDALPELDLAVDSPLDDGTRAVEYTWWIDRGTHAAWKTGKSLVIKDDQLLLQGKHVLHVAARVVGQPESEDATPAEVPFTIDALAPFVTVAKDGKAAKITAWDLVSDKTALLGRYRVGDGAMTDWMPIAQMATVDVGSAATMDVEVKDEEGNVRQVHQDLIRGRADPTLTATGSGCGCSTPGRTPADDKNGALAIALVLGGLAYVVIRRRTNGRGPARHAHAVLALGAITAVAATSQGCACGSEGGGNTGCGSDCNQECKPPLAQGMPGSYTSLAKAKDGSIWIAGYNDALLEEGDSTLFGDLVVGKYDLGKQAVAWKTVDGLPQRADGTCADSPYDSWRNGETDSGDDVGLWTSIAISSEGPPMVSYYDATNKRLKFAIEDGGWKTFVLKEQNGADIGRYSKMIIAGDKPVVAFLQIEPGNGGKTRAKVVVARATTTKPHGPGDFKFEDAAVEEDNPCTPNGCGAGQQCLKAQGICADTTSGCTPADCGTGKVCATVDGKAQCETLANPIQTYPNVFGDYISLASGPQGLGIALYDRVRGNLVGLAESGGAWNRFILDGESGNRADNTAIDTGDVGVAASLVIDNAGLWHVSYVSGIDETLRYLTAQDGKPGNPEIVDDGSSVDGRPFPDGKHVVGDDSALRVDGDIVTIYYQDATVGALRRASGVTNGSTHKWDLRQLPQPNKFAGFFPAIVPGEDKAANWWRQSDHGAKSVTGDVTIISP